MKWEVKVSIYPPLENFRGGQHVGPGPQGVKVEIEELGLVAVCTYERSQFKNKKIAMEMLEWALASLGIKND